MPDNLREQQLDLLADALRALRAALKSLAPGTREYTQIGLMTASLVRIIREF